MTVSTTDITHWLLSKNGLSGRSKDPAVREANAELLMPFDNRTGALSTLDHWKDAKGEVKVMSTCALFAMAYLRWLGVDHPLLERPYLGHNDCTLIVPAACKAGGRWIEDKSDELTAFPAIGDVIRIGMDGESPVHFLVVADVVASDSAIVAMQGGGGAGDLVHDSRHILVISRGFPYLVDAERPYRDAAETVPNGRRVTGRGVLL